MSSAVWLFINHIKSWETIPVLRDAHYKKKKEFYLVLSFSFKNQLFHFLDSPAGIAKGATLQPTWEVSKGRIVGSKLGNCANEETQFNCHREIIK